MAPQARGGDSQPDALQDRRDCVLRCTWVHASGDFSEEPALACCGFYSVAADRVVVRVGAYGVHRNLFSRQPDSQFPGAVRYGNPAQVSAWRTGHWSDFGRGVLLWRIDAAVWAGVVFLRAGVWRGASAFVDCNAARILSRRAGNCRGRQRRAVGRNAVADFAREVLANASRFLSRGAARKFGRVFAGGAGNRKNDYKRTVPGGTYCFGWWISWSHFPAALGAIAAVFSFGRGACGRLGKSAGLLPAISGARAGSGDCRSRRAATGALQPARLFFDRRDHRALGSRGGIVQPAKQFLPREWNRGGDCHGSAAGMAFADLAKLDATKRKLKTGRPAKHFTEPCQQIEVSLRLHFSFEHGGHGGNHAGADARESRLGHAQRHAGVRRRAPLCDRLSIGNLNHPLSGFPVAAEFILNFSGEAAGKLRLEGARHSLENNRSEQRHHALNLAVAAIADQPSEHGAAGAVGCGGVCGHRRRDLRVHAHGAHRPGFALRRDDVFGFHKTRGRAAGERLFRGAGEPRALFNLVRFLFFGKMRHYRLRKKLETFADVFVAVVAGLRGEDHQVHSGALIAREQLDELRGRAHGSTEGAEPFFEELDSEGTVIGADELAREAVVFALLDEHVPDVGDARLVFAEYVVVGEREPKKLPAVNAAVNGGLLVLVAHEREHDGHLRVDRQPRGDALGAGDNSVVVIHPGFGGFGLDEGKGKRAEAFASCRENGVAAAAGHPKRRMRLLLGLGNDVARRHGKETAVMSGKGFFGHHADNGIERFFPLIVLEVAVHTKTAQLCLRAALPRAEFHASAGNEVEHADAFGNAGGMIETERKLQDAVAETNALG